MKRIKIGDAERDLDSVDHSWIQQHLEDLRRQGKKVCVEITLHAGSVSMILSTPGCGPFEAADRQANRQEEKILALWRKNHLDTDRFTTHELLDFVDRVDIL